MVSNELKSIITNIVPFLESMASLISFVTHRSAVSVEWCFLYSVVIQRVVIENAVSGDQELGFGVPQGSVLGPKIYCIITLMQMTHSYI